MNVIEKIKHIGQAIASGYRRLGEVDCPDEVDIFSEDVENRDLYKKTLDNADKRYNNLTSDYSSSKNGGQGNSSPIVEIVTIDPRVVIAGQKLNKVVNTQESVSINHDKTIEEK